MFSFGQIPCALHDTFCQHSRAPEETKLARIEEEEDDNELREDADSHIWLLPWIPPTPNATTLPKGLSTPAQIYRFLRGA